MFGGGVGVYASLLEIRLQTAFQLQRNWNEEVKVISSTAFPLLVSFVGLFSNHRVLLSVCTGDTLS